MLDSSLDRFVADALSLVGYEFTSVHSVWSGADRISDQEIIEWCRKNGYIWVHADDSAKKDHARQILESQIRTLWVYRKDGKMTGAQQLRALAWFLDEAWARFQQRPNQRHLRIRSHGQPPHTKVALEAYEVGRRRPPS